MRRAERGSVADEARLVLFGSRMLASSHSKALARLPQMPWIGRAAQTPRYRAELSVGWA